MTARIASVGSTHTHVDAYLSTGSSPGSTGPPSALLSSASRCGDVNSDSRWDDLTTALAAVEACSEREEARCVS